jgi:hypothetical protein
VPFALLRPDVRLTLTEPAAGGRAFLATALRELDVRAALLAERVDDLPAGAFDAAGARAVFPPGEWLERGARLVVPGGSVLLFLGAESDWQPAVRVTVVATSGTRPGPVDIAWWRQSRSGRECSTWNTDRGRRARLTRCVLPPDQPPYTAPTCFTWNTPPHRTPWVPCSAPSSTN